MKSITDILFTTSLIFAVFLLPACSDNKLSIKTKYESIAYHQLKTYRWYDKSKPEADSKVSAAILQFIKDEIDRELTTKKLTLQQEGDVDFYVNVSVTAKDHVDMKEQLSYSGTAPGYSWNRESGFRKIEYIEPETEYIHHRDGSMVIDIIDSSSDKLIWRGIAEKRLTKELTKTQREKLIKIAVSTVLADFPPKTGG